MTKEPFTSSKFKTLKEITISSFLQSLQQERVIDSVELEVETIECDQCDGVGWFEGGGLAIQTICKCCNGAGELGLLSKPKLSPSGDYEAISVTYKK